MGQRVRKVGQKAGLERWAKKQGWKGGLERRMNVAKEGWKGVPKQKACDACAHQLVEEYHQFGRGSRVLAWSLGRDVSTGQHARLPGCVGVWVCRWRLLARKARPPND